MTKLETITAEDLQNRTYKPTPFLVDELIPASLQTQRQMTSAHVSTVC